MTVHMCYLKPFIPCSNLRQPNLAPVHTSLRTLSTPKPSNDGHVSNVFSPMFPILLHMFKYLLKRFLCSNLQGWQPAPLNGLRRVYNVITSDLSFAPLVTPLKLPSLDSPTLLNFYMLDFSELSPGDILYFFSLLNHFLGHIVYSAALRIQVYGNNSNISFLAPFLFHETQTHTSHG